MTTQFNTRLLNVDLQVVSDFWSDFAQMQESAMQHQNQYF